MIPRRALTELRDALKKQAAVALLGPRQVGKTTLAMLIAQESDSLYLDLESTTDRAKLSEPESFLQAYEDRLVILDEIHRVPDLMPILRGMIDSGRRRGFQAGRFLILGSASLELLRQSGETLAGRIRYLELGQLDIQEVGSENTERLWLRGGFPDSFLAADEATSLDWREDLIRTYLERDIPQLGPRIPAETLRRFWTMLAHGQGGLHNASSIGMSIEVSSQTVSRYTDLLVDLLLVRRLQPYLTNVRKRLVKSPKIYIRDSGLVHALLNLETREKLLGHPVAGGSWEGLAIENMILSTPKRTVPGFYRTAAGAEIDLVLELPGGERWAIEVKRSSTSNPTRGFQQACQDLNPTKRFLVHSGTDRFPLKHDCEAIGLYEISTKLSQLR